MKKFNVVLENQLDFVQHKDVFTAIDKESAETSAINHFAKALHVLADDLEVLVSVEIMPDENINEN